jgi:thymidylate kinase
VAFRALRRAGFSPALRDTALACHHLSIGRDRARRYRRGLQEANRGCIVLFDRFPAECISRDPDHRVLDGPQITAVLGNRRGPLLRRLAAWEERMYHRYEPPDVLVVLVADADVAASRKPDHDLTTIARKRRAAIELADRAEAQGVQVIRIDANQAFDDVLRAAKTGLWDAM